VKTTVLQRAIALMSDGRERSEFDIECALDAPSAGRRWREYMAGLRANGIDRYSERWRVTANKDGRFKLFKLKEDST